MLASLLVQQWILCKVHNALDVHNLKGKSSEMTHYELIWQESHLPALASDKGSRAAAIMSVSAVACLSLIAGLPAGPAMGLLCRCPWSLLAAAMTEQPFPAAGAGCTLTS